MARHIEDEVKYYYDSHSIEEDLMGETAFHHALVHYLIEVLTWLFHGQRYAIYGNLNIYQTADAMEYPIAPDVAIIKGVAYQPTIRSWRVGKSGPAPQVVLEIASEETWRKDLLEKPGKYADMGVQEYYAYDPHEPSLPRSAGRRLFGWPLDQNRKIMRPMLPRPDGSLWSPALDSWLVPDGPTLRLYDSADQMRMTRAEAEARRSQAMAEKLRSLGIDPDQLI
jgi:Uma2 family endonuclease